MKVSIVIPVYNDPQGLETTLESLLDQEADDFEVIVCDNGSTDTTDEVAREYAQRSNVRYVLEDTIQSSYAARNAGIDESEGTIIAFLDADTWVDPDYVGSIRRKVIDHDRDYMGCSVEIVGGDDLVSRYNKAFGFPVAEFLENSHFSPTNCLVVRKRVFEQVGTFEDRLVSTGDVVFGRRVHDAGFEQVYEPSITIYHPVREAVSEHVSKAIRIGRGREQIRRHAIDRELARPILHPENFLPSDPRYFLSRIDTSYGSMPEIVVWYLFSAVLTWCTTYGRIAERLHPTNED